MIIDLTRLNSGIDREVHVDEVYTFQKEELTGTDVTSIDDVQITGTIHKNATGNLVITLDVEGTMIIPCAITLNPVEYPFYISIEEELEEDCSSDIKYQNRLDILSIIWENILMEIPMRVISEDAENIELSGDGWQLIRDEEKIENSEQPKLKDLL